MYNLERPPGVPAEFGVALPLESLGFPGLYAHTLIEGGVSWHSETGLSKESTVIDSGDSHQFFKVHNIGDAPPLLESALIINGTAGKAATTF